MTHRGLLSSSPLFISHFLDTPITHGPAAAKLCCFITHTPISNSTEQGCGCGDLFRASLSFLLRSTSPSIGDK